MHIKIIYYCESILTLDFNRDFRRCLPRDEQEREQRKSEPPPEPVKVDWSISKVIRLLRMNDRQSELDVVKRERRESENGDVILVERHDDDDLKDVTDPDPDDIEFQNQRLSHGELTKDEKKRWKRRYKGEAVFMVCKIFSLNSITNKLIKIKV